MNLNKETTTQQILLNIFKNNQKVVDFLFNVKIVDKINDFKLRELFEKPIKNYLIGKIKDDLKHKTGQRMEILTELFKGTPFEENFSYVTRFHNEECKQESGKHALAHHYNDRDANESQTYHCCVFCGEEWETTRGGRGINSIFIQAGGRAYDKFKKTSLSLQKLILQNPTDEEITTFVAGLLDLTL